MPSSLSIEFLRNAWTAARNWAAAATPLLHPRVLSAWRRHTGVAAKINKAQIAQPPKKNEREPEEERERTRGRLYDVI